MKKAEKRHDRGKDCHHGEDHNPNWLDLAVLVNIDGSVVFSHSVALSWRLFFSLSHPNRP